MSTPELAIAKVNFSAVLFRKDPTALTRPEIESFHALLNDAIVQCSPSNVQKCKRWILSHLRPSTARLAALAKYLVALSGSVSAAEAAAKAGSNPKTKPSARRKHLHILYILNDALYHTCVRDRDDALARAFETSLTTLFRNSASFQNCPKHIKKLERLVDLWVEQRYFSPAATSGLRDVIREAPLGIKPPSSPGHDNSASATVATAKVTKDAPFSLPATHGDPSTPWYDLPAGNWLPHLTPHSTKAMHPDMIKPLQLAAGPADKSLAQAVRDLLLDVDRIYSRGGGGAGPGDEQQHVADRGEMGERIVIDEITGDIIGGDTYYGWSREFCEKMKEHKKKPKGGAPGQPGRGRDSRGGSYSPSVSRSRSQSRSPVGPRRSRSPRNDSRSPPAFKRRRLSNDSRSPSGHDRNRSGSRGRSRDPNKSGRFRSHSRSRTKSNTPPREFRSRSRPTPRSPSPSPSGSRHRDRSGSPGHGRRSRRSYGYGGNDNSYNSGWPGASDHGPASRTPSIPPAPSAPAPHHQHLPGPIHAFPPPPIPMAGGGFPQFDNLPPPPPPPPQGYQGQWLPPPPNWFPPPPHQVSSQSGWQQQQQQQQPPPPSFPPHQQAFHGRGGGGGGYRRGRGRGGGYERGRGW